MTFVGPRMVKTAACGAAFLKDFTKRCSHTSTRCKFQSALLSNKHLCPGRTQCTQTVWPSSSSECSGSSFSTTSSPFSSTSSQTFLTTSTKANLPSRSQHSSAQSNTQTGTVDPDEIRHFSQMADFWWKGSAFALLRAMNHLRVPFIIDAVAPSRREVNSRPLEGVKIADVGCGGGLLSLPLARLGADVTGIDMSADTIAAARAHIVNSQEGVSLEFRHTSVEELAESLQDKGDSERFDAVVSSEVVEHVSDVGLFVRKCSEIIKPGGSLIFTTINRTRISLLYVIGIAEYVMGVVPRGTHSWDKFVTPAELIYQLEKNGCAVRCTHGMSVNLMTGSWAWSDNVSLNYALHAVKQPSGTDGLKPAEGAKAGDGLQQPTGGDKF